MKHIVSYCIFFLLNCFFYSTIHAQALITYGRYAISKEEFLKAYGKNNITGKPTEQSYRDYLGLYTKYKLKVRAAYDMRLDTLPNQVAELLNFRNQIVDQYMTDENSTNRLVNEAFTRSQKDIHIAHIFIAVPKNASPADTLKAYKKATEAYAALKSGKDFGETAANYSDDPFAKTNHGDLGFITVFTLPYELETLAYNTAPGKFSTLYRSKSGFHIFKNIEERKAIGKMRAAQILLVFPYHASDAEKADTKQRADSIYHALLNGSDFAELAKKFSGDNMSFQNGGDMPEFGVGRYESVFEKAAFALKKDGDISEPVETDFGYHIIKRLMRKPVSNTKDKATMDALRQQVLGDSRINVAKKEMLQTILGQTKFKWGKFDENHLWAYTDSSLQNKTLPKFSDINDQAIIFSFAKKSFTVKQWVDYRKSIQNLHAPGTKTNKEMFDDYRQAVAFEYYRNYLEDYNKTFAAQLNEFRDGNLLFEIMQRQVWDKASADSVGLKKYFDEHHDNYIWQPSADAIIFTCSNEKAARDIMNSLPNNVNKWRKIIDSSKGMAQADSGRFELTQLPPAEGNHFEPGRFSSFAKSSSDNSLTLAYIIHLYNDRMPRTFADARGLVINDYQNFIEDKWIAELKKKYPVKINEAVLKSLVK